MRTHYTLPELPSGYALSPCRGMWSIVMPAAATNLITNPSFEISDDGYIAFSGSASRATSRQRHGVYSLQIDPIDPTGGVQYALTLAPNTTYTWSLDEQSEPGVAYSMRVLDETFPADYLSSALEYRGTGHWERRRLSFVTGSGASYRLTLAQNGDVDDSMPRFFTDGWMLCESPSDTTYIDGDQPGCTWVGLPHASVSSRSAQSRRGGRTIELDAYGFTVTGEIGLGMQPAEDITTPTGLLGGALYQRTVQRVRPFSLVGQFAATSFAQLQRLRAELHAALTPFSLAEQQPLVLRYRAVENGRAIGDELEILCHYTGGLEGSTDNLYGERAAIQFTQYSGTILGVGEAGASLAASDSIADADYIVERTSSGAWHALAGGLSGPVVHAAVYGPDGNLYVGGDFTTAYNASGTGDPVTVNNVARWDGSSWAALGGGFDNDVQALAFDASGNLYAGGIFTDTDYPYLAMWNGAAWAPIGLDTDATGSVFALAFDAASNLYVGGSFTDWAALGDADGIVRWDGADWDVPGGGTGADGAVYALLYDPLRLIVVTGGAFTTIGGVSADRIAAFNTQTNGWQEMGQGFNDTVFAVGRDATNTIFAGGEFTADDPYVSRRDNDFPSHLWGPLAGGDLDNSVFAMTLAHPEERMVFGGAFTSAGSLAFADSFALWTGTGWRALDIDLPGVATVTALASHADGRLAVGYDTTGTAASSTTDTTVTNAGSAPAAPIFVATGAGRIESIVNWTSGKGIYLDLTLVDGEVLTIDLTPGAIQILSSWQGNLGGTVLSGSDLASWRLLPGANTIVAKSDVPILMRWRAAYTSLAGAAY